MDHRSLVKRSQARSFASRQWSRFRSIALPVVALGLLATWLVPPFSNVWQWLDELVFRGLNETLYWGTTWQKAAAIANCRAFDLVAGTVMVALLTMHICRGDRRRRRSAWLSSGALVLVILAGHLVFVDGLVHGVLGYQRESPTLASPDLLRLSQLLPEWPAKDTSPWSFPGDHGYVLLCVALFLTFFSDRDLAWAGWFAAIVFSMPRLVSGAHWLSDIAVGSLALALLSIDVLLLPAVHQYLKPDAGGDVITGHSQDKTDVRQHAA